MEHVVEVEHVSSASGVTLRPKKVGIPTAYAGRAGVRRDKRDIHGFTRYSNSRLLITINRLKFLTGVFCKKSNSLLVFSSDPSLLTAC